MRALGAAATPKAKAPKKHETKATPKPETKARTPETNARPMKAAKNAVARIQIHTFGLDALLVHRKGSSNEVWRGYKSRFDVELHALFDCRRPFRKPRCKRRHNGHHDEFIEGVVAKPEFKHWLANVKGNFVKKHKVHNPNDTFHIGLFCRAGNNRSVGCSLILATIWDFHGYTVLPVIHRSRVFWKDRGICNSECVTCQNGENQTTMGDSMGVAGKVAPKDTVLFWRIGAEKKRWWFDGMVLDVLSVVCPTGATATIVGMS